ncbi:hypothetical protein OG963_00180 [Streptomyces sp. NBC_01707]|uniref:hypothetical protein n=1 Tax=unclassified Streptomyces TaxID=2593676 RepID=UPI002E0DE90E|nr:hypothetical protein OG763_43360 [Streptomyces sp. NBC_01230]
MTYFITFRTWFSRSADAAEADIAAGPLYRPGGLESLQQLRDRGVFRSENRLPDHAPAMTRETDGAALGP